jgi:Cu/Ag efflux pump CusA
MLGGTLASALLTLFVMPLVLMMYLSGKEKRIVKH